MNPIFNEKTISRTGTPVIIDNGVMTISGAIKKIALLLVFLLAAAAYTWKIYYGSYNPSAITPWIWGGAIGAFVIAMIISFKPKTAPYLALLYAMGEGLFIGGISAIYNNIFATRNEAGEVVANGGIIGSAVLITALVLLTMLLVYRSRVINVQSGAFSKVLMTALISVMAFYFIGLIVRLICGADCAFVQLLYGSSMLSIGINIVIAGIAAFCLLQDFLLIEKGAAMGAPKYMEWYGAFGLMVTLVWLYLEILQILAKMQSRN